MPRSVAADKIAKKHFSFILFPLCVQVFFVNPSYLHIQETDVLLRHLLRSFIRSKVTKVNKIPRSGRYTFYFILAHYLCVR